MAESTSLPLPQNKTDLHLLPGMLLHPRKAFAQVGAENKRAWVMPLLLLSLTTLAALLVNSYFVSRAAMSVPPELPPDWQYWSPEMQNDFMQAQQATQSPTILYVLPAVLGLAKLWLGWVILSGLLHLVSTLMGGRETITDALNIYAFSVLPFALRDGLRVVFVWMAQHPIQKAGLSGFVADGAMGAPFWGQILVNFDLFLVWHAVLLVIGFQVFANLPRKKAVAVVLSVLALSLLVQAGLGTLGTRIGAMLSPG